jgi:hypothetical protein
VLCLRRRTEAVRAQPLTVWSLTWRASPIKGSAALSRARRATPALHSAGAVGDRRLAVPQSAPPAEDHVWFEDRWMVASLSDE